MYKKKILFIHTCGSLSGAAHSLITLIKHLDKEKFEIHIFSPSGKAYDALEKVAHKIYNISPLPELISISGYPFNYLRLIYCLILLPNLKKVITEVIKLSPDIIHLNEISLTPLAKKLKKYGFKIIMHARLVLDYKTPLLNKLIVHRLKKYADHIICIDGSVEFFLKQTGKTSIVYNSYQFKQTELTALNESSQKFVILFLANLMRQKGIFDLIKAAKQLKNISNCEILIAGSNSRPDSFFNSLKGKLLSFMGIVVNNRVKIEKLIKSNNLINIKLLGHVDNISAIIKQASVLIFPSYMNGPSRSIFEAGVFGVPSVIALHHKMEDVVENNVTGIIIDEGSPSQIVSSITKLYQDKKLCKKLGLNASKKYLTLNNPVINNNKIEKIYGNLIGK